MPNTRTKKEEEMKTWLATLTLTALTAAALLLPSASTYASGSKLYVDDDKQQCPTAQFFTIQEAVDAAKPGDTVYVCSGSYAEKVTITKKLTLRSRVFDGQAFPLLANFVGGAATIKVVDTKDVTIRDLRLAGTSNNVGVLMNRTEHVTVQSLTLSDFSVGIAAASSNKSIIQNNTLINMSTGITVVGSSSAKVTQNTVTAARFLGIHLDSAIKTTVSKNTVVNSDSGIGTDNVESKDNTFDGNIIKNSVQFDAIDITKGSKTAGTADTWKNNTCVTSNPAGLCKK